MQLYRVQISGERDCPLSLHLRKQQQAFLAWQASRHQSPSLLLDAWPCLPSLYLGTCWRMENYCRGKRWKEVSCRTEAGLKRGACFPQSYHVAWQRQHNFYGTAIARSPSWLQGAVLGSPLSAWAPALPNYVRYRCQQVHLSFLGKTQCVIYYARLGI